MRLYLELVKLSFQRTLAYRSATIAGLLTNLFFGLLRASVMVALYGARTDVAGISLTGAITFTGVSQAIIAFLSLFGWWEVMQTVYSGSIGADLLKPFNYFMFWLARDFGRALSNFVLRAMPLMLAYAVMFRITFPATAGHWLAVFASLLLCWLVSFAWRFLVNLSAFWTSDARGVGRFAYGVALFMCGFLMPLRFFPDWFVALCNLTPFPSMVNTPIEVYLGVLNGAELAQALLVQLVWFAVLCLACWLVMRAGVRRLVIQGG